MIKDEAADKPSAVLSNDYVFSADNEISYFLFICRFLFRSSDWTLGNAIDKNVGQILLMKWKRLTLQIGDLAEQVLVEVVSSNHLQFSQAFRHISWVWLIFLK